MILRFKCPMQWSHDMMRERVRAELSGHEINNLEYFVRIREDRGLELSIHKGRKPFIMNTEEELSIHKSLFKLKLQVWEAEQSVIGDKQ